MGVDIVRDSPGIGRELAMVVSLGVSLSIKR